MKTTTIFGIAIVFILIAFINNADLTPALEPTGVQHISSYTRIWLVD